MKFIQKHPIVVAITPLLLFALLVVPYSWINEAFLVDWLGCGCPQIDEAGNLYEPNFNANDFTAYFWHIVAVIGTVIAFITSRHLFPEKRIWRIVYVVAISVMSELIAYGLSRYMMWN